MPDDRNLDDRGLDALISAAADHPVDVGALTTRVLARLRDEPQGLFDWLLALPVPRMLPAGFAAVLAVTPIAVATLPLPVDPAEAAILGLATGAPLGDLLGELHGITE